VMRVRSMCFAPPWSSDSIDCFLKRISRPTTRISGLAVMRRMEPVRTLLFCADRFSASGINRYLFLLDYPR
jgi:hypothetical protein